MQQLALVLNPFLFSKYVLIICLIMEFKYHFAERNCKRSPSGVEFLGFINVSTSGKACLNWENFDEISHPFVEEFNANNFCRMAISKGFVEIPLNRPWCYTQEGPESCDIPYCGGCILHYEKWWCIVWKFSPFETNVSHQKVFKYKRRLSDASLKKPGWFGKLEKWNWYSSLQLVPTEIKIII